MSEYRATRDRTVRQFLQHAIVVDDRAYRIDDDNDRRHDLDVEELVASFLKQGIICSAIAPKFTAGADQNDDEDIDEDASALGDDILGYVVKVARRADIVVVDWQMNDNDDGATAMSIIDNILDEEHGERLRFIAIYTGEDDTDRISSRIREGINRSGIDFKLDDSGLNRLHWKHCHIHIYVKEGREPTDISNFVDTLIEDFAEAMEGLLPAIALTSLSAIRDNAHKVLERFTTDLDPAYLAHYICLPNPDEAEGHIISQIISELHAIINDAAENSMPARQDEVLGWIDKKHQRMGGGDAKFVFNEKQLSLSQTKELAKVGFKESNSLGRRDWEYLSAGFAMGEDSEDNILDKRLAWMMTFRTIYDTGDIRLHLGTVLRRESDNQFLVCMRPKCDRLQAKDNPHSFQFLPLMKIGDHNNPEGKTRLVLKTEGDRYEEYYVETNMSNWIMINFDSDHDNPIEAENIDGQFYFFNSIEGTKFEWIGEMKPEFAQNIVQHLANYLSRVAIDNSEWLRRKERLGN